MSVFSILFTICILLSSKATNAATLSIIVDNSDMETYPVGSTVEVQVGTRVLLISQRECVWEWEIENMNSHALTSETSGVVRLLHIVPYTREEAGVYRCVYFNTEYNITLLAGKSNLFRRYGVSSIERVRNNSIVLLLTTDVHISCIQNVVLARTGGYWHGPDGAAVNGDVSTENIVNKGEAVLHIEVRDGGNVTEGVYTCMTDLGDHFRVQVYRDEYAIVRGSGVRELLGGGAEVRFVGIGEEVSLVCPRDSIPAYLGDKEGNIIKLVQIIYIPLFTSNEAGLYQCRSERADKHIQLLAEGSALLLYNSSKLSVLRNDSVLVVGQPESISVVCAGSTSNNGIGSTWYLYGEPVPPLNGTLVQLNSDLGGLELDFSKFTAADQGEYSCEAGVYSGTRQVHTTAIYLEELELEFVTDTGAVINSSTVIFLHSRQFSTVTCRSAAFYPGITSVNWTSTPPGYNSVNTKTLDLSGITTSGLYTCTAASRYSTGIKSLYILLDNTHANLTLSYNNRTFEFSTPDVNTLEIEVGTLNVTIQCLAFKPELVLPTGVKYTNSDASIQSVTYKIDAMTPNYNGIVKCTGVSHENTGVRLKAVGVGLIGRSEVRIETLNDGISIVGKTKYFFCTGSDLNLTSKWKGSDISDGNMFFRLFVYQEILKFIPHETPEGFYTCEARNESGGVEKITRGLFYSQPYGPDISILVNGSNLVEMQYTLLSNNSVGLQCNSESYPLPLSTFWYQNITLDILSNLTKFNLTLTQPNISLTCVVRTIYSTNQKSFTIRNPFLTNRRSIPSTAPNKTSAISNTSNFTNSRNISTNNAPTVYILIVMLTIAIIVPCIVLSVVAIIHKTPANVKEHIEKWYKEKQFRYSRRERRENRIEEAKRKEKFQKFTINKANYKEKYKFTPIEEAFFDEKVLLFWEPIEIQKEYEDMVELAGIKNVKQTEEPVRITKRVDTKDDNIREGVEIGKKKKQRKDTPKGSYEQIRTSRSTTPNAEVEIPETNPLLSESETRAKDKAENDEKKKDKGHLIIDIPECPDFILVKGPYIKEARKWRRKGRRANKDPELEKKIRYLNFLSDKDVDDVVFIAYKPENSSLEPENSSSESEDSVSKPEDQQNSTLKRSEIVFYPQDPKDKAIEIKDKMSSFTIKTKSFFSSPFYTMRQLVILKVDMKKKKKETKEIRLFHFLTWPKVEVGSKAYPFIEFVRALHYTKKNSLKQKSIVLHCDAGERSATFISIYYLMRRTERDQDFNLVEFFCLLYEQAKLFPTYTQFEFLHSIILDLTLNNTTCQATALDIKYKHLFKKARECIPRTEGRVGRFMEILETEEKEASKTRAQIQDEKDQKLQSLEEKFQRRQRRRGDNQKSEKEKDRKGENMEGEFEEIQGLGLVKDDDSFISDGEIEYLDDPRQFIPTLTDCILPEPLFIKRDPAVNRYREEVRERKREKRKLKTAENDEIKKTNNIQTEVQQDSQTIENKKGDVELVNLPMKSTESKPYSYQKLESSSPQRQPSQEVADTNKKKKDKEDLIKDTENEFKQLQMFRPHLLHTFAHPPLSTNYRTHKKHVDEDEWKAEQNSDREREKEQETKKDEIQTYKRVKTIEEKLAQDESTRFEQFKFGQRQAQVYGPNIVEENQAQAFWIHSIYGDEIVALRHPCVNDFEFDNFNHPQFNLHLYKQQRIPTVVALCTFEELIGAYRAKKELKHNNVKRDGTQMLTPYWPPVGQEENFGPFKVKTISTDVFDDDKVMQWYDLEYTDTKDLDEHSIRVFLCRDWDTLMEANHTTGRHDRFVHFVTRVFAYTKQTRSDQIAVHCSDIQPYSALFSAVFYALRQAENEGKIDMYQIVKGIQMSRRQSCVFTEEDQYFLSLALTSDCLLNVAKARKELMHYL